MDHKIIQYKKQGKPFPEPIIIEWLIQLLLAVQYMHSRYTTIFIQIDFIDDIDKCTQSRYTVYGVRWHKIYSFEIY